MGILSEAYIELILSQQQGSLAECEYAFRFVVLAQMSGLGRQLREASIWVLHTIQSEAGSGKPVLQLDVEALATAGTEDLWGRNPMGWR